MHTGAVRVPRAQLDMGIHQVGDTVIRPQYRRRSFPDQYGYNVGCLEGVNPFLISDVPVNDGVNHPADRPHAGAG